METTDSHLRPLPVKAVLPSPLEETAVRLHPGSRQVLHAFWNVADLNQELCKLIDRLRRRERWMRWILTVETSLLAGIAVLVADQIGSPASLWFGLFLLLAGGTALAAAMLWDLARKRSAVSTQPNAESRTLNATGCRRDPCPDDDDAPDPEHSPLPIG